MPQFKWEKEDMKYSICFFPLIGIVIGAICYGWCLLVRAFDINLLASTLLFFVIPIAVTGGIHVDGFMDCSDVFSSYREKEKKLEILKDPHIPRKSRTRRSDLSRAMTATLSAPRKQGALPLTRRAP